MDESYYIKLNRDEKTRAQPVSGSVLPCVADCCCVCCGVLQCVLQSAPPVFGLVYPV